MTTVTTPTLHDAASALAERNADWASTQNGVGYNKSDSWLGAALAGIPQAEWTPEMTYTAWRMLRKYTKQLAGYGIAYDEIPVPAKPDTEDDEARATARTQTWNKRGERNVRDSGKIERVADGGFIVTFPYDKETVTRVKEIPGRRFDGETKAWFVPESEEGIVGLAKFARRTGIEPADAELAEWLDAFAADYVEKPSKRIEMDGDGTARVIFPYDPDMVRAIKSVGTAKWDNARKLWTVKLDGGGASLAGFADHNGFHTDADVRDGIATATAIAEARAVASKALDAEIFIDGVGAILHPFQRGGVKYLVETEAAILGDEMGLGKTPQSLGAAQFLDSFPAAAIVPNLAKRNWLREIDFWLPERSMTILDGQKKSVKIKRITLPTDPDNNVRAKYEGIAANDEDARTRKQAEYALHWDDVRIANPERVIETNNLDAEIIIVNYDIVARKPSGKIAAAFEQKLGLVPETLAVGLAQLGIVALIADESHYLKNPRAARTKAVKLLAKTVKYKFLLTGTPILNRPVEWVPQLDIVGALPAFGGFFGFARRYCYAGPGYNGKPDFSGAQNLPELNARLREICYVRREKKDVLTELPPVQRQTIELPLASIRDYQRVADDVISWIKQRAASDKDFLAEIADLDAEIRQEKVRERQTSAAQRAQRAEILVRLNALRLVCAQQKVPAITEWITAWLEDNPGEKIIVFAWHQEIQKALLDAFPGSARIIADDAAAKRTENEHRFQEDPNCRLLVASINVSGVSLTLTAAHTVAFTELPWRPGDIDQCEGRAYGRLNDAHGINSYYLVGEDTIDADMADLIDAKRVVVDEATSGKAGASGAGILASLIGRLLKLDDLEDAA